MSIVHSKFSVITALVALDLSLFIWHLSCNLSSMRHLACDDCTIASIAVRVIRVWKPAYHDEIATPLRKYQKLYGRK